MPSITPEIIIALIDLAKGLLWPGLILIVLCWFGKDIRKLIPRIKRAGAGGVELEPEAAEQQAQLPPPEAPSDTANGFSGKLRDFRGESRSKAMHDLELELRSNIEADVASGKITPDERLDYAIRHLALTRLERHFYRVYGMIFGSQMLSLTVLRNTGGTAAMAALKRGFESAKQDDPEFYGEYKFEEWLSFMTSNDLIKVEGDSVTITPIGEDFLAFLFAYKLPQKRG
jgi:hypothetical protein